MDRITAPVLFGRKMKRISPAFDTCVGWELKIDADVFPLVFRYFAFDGGAHSAVAIVGGVNCGDAQFETREAALSWLTAQRDRLVLQLQSKQ